MLQETTKTDRHFDKEAPLRLPRRGLTVATMEISDTHATATFRTHSFSTPLTSPHGTLITAFSHKGSDYVARFADHGREISILPAGNEVVGLSLQHRLFVSTVPTDLGHFLLTPFRGTGLPRLLSKIAVDHALASTGQASGTVRFAHIRDLLLQSGLTVKHEQPISLEERLSSQATERQRRAMGMGFDYDEAKFLDNKLFMSRQADAQIRETLSHCNLYTSVRIFDFKDGAFRDTSRPR